ncbi:hypothetical protein LTR72_011477 [Exophiala xenobiotica]|nr:hypothetical protein LTR92_010786 [Exophiala xenobiotica]KAK5215467.1 hypothetical protein LTR72_011477 [Exophiala xenobiotica]
MAEVCRTDFEDEQTKETYLRSNETPEELKYSMKVMYSTIVEWNESMSKADEDDAKTDEGER